MSPDGNLAVRFKDINGFKKPFVDILHDFFNRLGKNLSIFPRDRSVVVFWEAGYPSCAFELLALTVERLGLACHESPYIWERRLPSLPMVEVVERRQHDQRLCCPKNQKH